MAVGAGCPWQLHKRPNKGLGEKQDSLENFLILTDLFFKLLYQTITPECISVLSLSEFTRCFLDFTIQFNHSCSHISCMQQAPRPQSMAWKHQHHSLTPAPVHSLPTIPLVSNLSISAARPLLRIWQRLLFPRDTKYTGANV